MDKPLNDEMLSLMNFMRDKFYLRYIDIIRLFIPPSLRLEADATLKRLFVLKTQNLTELVKFKNAPKQAELAEYLLKNGLGAFRNVRHRGTVLERLCCKIRKRGGKKAV